MLQFLSTVHLTQSVEFSFNHDPKPASTTIYETVLNICIDIQNRLPQPSITNDSYSKLPQHRFSPIFHNEIVKYNALLDVIHNSLNAIVNSIRGTDMQFNQFDRVLNEIACNKIPFIWLNVSYLTSKSLSCYVTDLLIRVSYIRSQVADNGPSNVVWYSAMYFPRAIIATVKQAFCEHKRIEYDDIYMSVEVTAYDSHESGEFESFIKVN